MSVFSFYPYLKSNREIVESTLEHCKSLSKVPPKPHPTMKFNVMAILKVGAPIWFHINEKGESRRVACYSQGNGFTTIQDIDDVYNIIQNNCIAWCSIKENEIV